MSWQPGRQVITAQDHADWQAWRKTRKLELQRERRRVFKRIDYYPSKEAWALIEPLLARCVGGDMSSVINRLLTEAQEAPE